MTCWNKQIIIQTRQSVDGWNDDEMSGTLTSMKEDDRGAERKPGVIKRRGVHIKQRRSRGWRRITHGGRCQVGQKDCAVLSH